MKFISSLLLCIVFSSIPIFISKSMAGSEKFSISSKKVHKAKKSKEENNDETELKVPPQRKYRIRAQDIKFGLITEYSADLTYSDAGIWLIIYDHPKEIQNILVDSSDVIKVAEQAEHEEKLAKKLEAIVYRINPNTVKESQENDQTDSSKLKEEFRRNSEQHSYLIPFRVVKNCEYKLIGPDHMRKSNSIQFNTIQESNPYNFIQAKPIGLSYMNIEIWVDDAWVEYTEIKEDNINTLAEACTKNRDELKTAAKIYMEKFGFRKETANKEREINKKIKEQEALWKLMGEKMTKYKQLFSSYGFAPAKIEEELVKVKELKDGEPTHTVTFTYLKELKIHGHGEEAETTSE